MKFTLSWLKEHLSTDKSIEEITETLTMIGLEVESVSRPDLIYKDFVIGKVSGVLPHPDADKLKTCLVDIGDGKKYSIVCGANNLVDGMFGVFAKAGSVIPSSNITLKKTAIRGVVSEGMLLSEFELGISSNHDGIISLSSDEVAYKGGDKLSVGASYAKTFGLDDPVIEIAVTPNRSDCLGVRGVARDLAAASIGKLIDLDKINLTEDKVSIDSKTKFHASDAKFTISNDASDYCDQVAFASVFGLDNTKSLPQKIKNRLIAIGEKSISPLVDISNYLMFDLARPYHFYDLSKISKNGLSVKLCLEIKEDSFLALDGNKYKLKPNDLVIADGDKLSGLAGVVGGTSSSVDEKTKGVFIEVADFAPSLIANEVRDKNIDTEASRRFARGIDKSFQLDALNYAIDLILKVCGGSRSESKTTGKQPVDNKTIKLKFSKLDSFFGSKFDKKTAEDILSKLGFEIKVDSNSFTAKAPTWRTDIDNDQCLIEEIMRVYGLDKVEIAPFLAKSPIFNQHENSDFKIRQQLVKLGYFETINWTFTDQKLAKIATDDKLKIVALKNPMSSELDVMRPSLLPNLLKVIADNLDRKVSRLAVFEKGPIFYLSDDDKIVEEDRVVGLFAGNKIEESWIEPQRLIDSYDMKADLFTLLNSIGVNTANLKYDYSLSSCYHQGLSCNILLGNRKIASFGLLDQLYLEKNKIEKRVGYFEVFLKMLPDFRSKSSHRNKLTLSNYPYVLRDLAFILDKNITASDVISEIRRIKDRIIQEISVFDQYFFKEDTKSLPVTKSPTKSLGFRFKLESDQKTLTEEEIKQSLDKVVEVVCLKFGAKLRDQ